MLARHFFTRIPQVPQIIGETMRQRVQLTAKEGGLGGEVVAVVALRRDDVDYLVRHRRPEREPSPICPVNNRLAFQAT